MPDIIRHGSVMQDTEYNGVMPPDIVDQLTVKHSNPMQENLNYQPGGSNASGGSSGVSDTLVDTVTGKAYKLHVVDSKLTMSEVRP